MAALRNSLAELTYCSQVGSWPGNRLERSITPSTSVPYIQAHGSGIDANWRCTVKPKAPGTVVLGLLLPNPEPSLSHPVTVLCVVLRLVTDFWILVARDS